MKRFIFALPLLLAYCLTPKSLSAQNEVAFWGQDEAYLMRQASHIYTLIDEALTEYPPTTGAPTSRRLALYGLDAMLHEVKYDASEPLFNFVSSRINKVIEDMNTPVKKGMRIYKLYNDGFVARTKSATIAFDIYRGPNNKGRRLLTDEQAKAIVEQCDILFLSHNHGDHVDRFVVDRFIEAGKPVIAATNILSNVKGVTHYRSESEILEKSVVLKNSKELQFKIYPGHQGADLICNVYAVTTPEGLTVAHTGDQYLKEDFEWIANVKNQKPRIDALLINCWSLDITEAIKGFNPRYVITGHENEMGHTIDHREAFWLTFDKLKSIEHDYVVMAWGEWFSFK
ncbi:MAG: MBL fold metallo-hydrolase [Alistipes sp.]|nr:MBL fold metallo-hydrolase [Alistipes sp.]